MTSTPKTYRADTVTRAETSTNPLPWREITFPQAISRALDELRVEAGRKAIAPYFDGRDGREVAETTVSRWITEPHRFPAHCLPVLVSLHANFRKFIFENLTARMNDSAEIVKRLSPKAAEEYRQVLEERFLDAAYGGPGRPGERE